MRLRPRASPRADCRMNETAPLSAKRQSRTLWCARRARRLRSRSSQIKSVTVRAPLDADTESIDRIVRKRTAWIIRQQKFFEQFLPKTPARAFVSGETHLYLGRKYRLRVRLSEQDGSETARRLPLRLTRRQPANAAQVKRLLYGWYAAHAQARFAERLTVCMDSAVGRSMSKRRKFKFGAWRNAGEAAGTVRDSDAESRPHSRAAGLH